MRDTASVQPLQIFACRLPPFQQFGGVIEQCVECLGQSLRVAGRNENPPSAVLQNLWNAPHLAANDCTSFLPRLGEDEAKRLAVRYKNKDVRRPVEWPGVGLEAEKLDPRCVAAGLSLLLEGAPVWALSDDRKCCHRMARRDQFKCRDEVAYSLAFIEAGDGQNGWPSQSDDIG